MARTAIVLFNLGGPDNPEAVKPFLYNLFIDPAIIRQPAPLRWLLAHLISSRRAPVARDIYKKIGGRSPILEQTEAQAQALGKALGDPETGVFIAMRYWHPFTEAVVEKVREFKPDKIILLPLYPQFSTSTTGSSFQAWDKAAKRAGLDVSTVRVCCYPEDMGFTDAVAAATSEALAKVSGPARILFSAHGLPKKFVTTGDPYQGQIEQSVAAVVAKMNRPDLDYVVCFQSRVGPMEWLQPYTENEIRRAAEDGKSIVIVPIAFVSEHSETLVELDIEYRDVALQAGVAEYIRVPTVGTHPAFIEGLASIVRHASTAQTQLVAPVDAQRCPAGFSACPCRLYAEVAG